MRQHLVLPATLAVALLSIATVSAFEQNPPPAGHTLGNVKGGNFRKANVVIEKKCISCHSSKVIENAVAAGKNMQEIQARMEQKGVALSADDRQVLGIFWQQTPLKKGR